MPAAKAPAPKIEVIAPEVPAIPAGHVRVKVRKKGADLITSAERNPDNSQKRYAAGDIVVMPVKTAAILEDKAFVDILEDGE